MHSVFCNSAPIKILFIYKLYRIIHKIFLFCNIGILYSNQEILKFGLQEATQWTQIYMKKNIPHVSAKTKTLPLFLFWNIEAELAIFEQAIIVEQEDADNCTAVCVVDCSLVDSKCLVIVLVHSDIHIILQHNKSNRASFTFWLLPSTHEFLIINCTKRVSKQLLTVFSIRNSSWVVNRN